MTEPAITVQAFHVSAGPNLPPTRVVIHATSPPHLSGTLASSAGMASDTARYFQDPDSGGSAHYIEDVGGEEHCVREDAIAWHAPPNQYSIGIEVCGLTSYTTEQWLSPYVWPAVERAALRARDVCDRWRLPWLHIGALDLLAGTKGVCGHADVTGAFHQSDHTDPGPNFPWEQFMAAGAPATPPPPPPVVIDYPGENMQLVKITVTGLVDGKPVSTDAQGNGSTLLTGTSADHVVNAYPNTAGYVPLPRFVGCQDEGGHARLEWVGPPLAPPFEAHVWVAE